MLHHLIFFDIKNNKEYLLTYDEIVERISECEWKFMKGGIHLKNKDQKNLLSLSERG